MKGITFLHPALYIEQTKEMGRGVFTSMDLEAETILEIAPVIVMPAKQRPIIDQTLLHDYIFEWGKLQKQCAMALGWISLYNHSYASNCEYMMHFRKQLMAIKTVAAITKGSELFINYNGEWNNTKPLWFEAK
jgi:SET domain-containing protein